MHSNGKPGDKCQRTRNYPNCLVMRVLKLVETGQYFYTLVTEEGQEMQHICREYTMPRYEKKTRVRGWILKNTRIGTVLNIKVYCHDDRYSIEFQVPSLFQDTTTSWVRIVNGVDKYVAESMLTKEEGGRSFGETHCYRKTTTKAHSNADFRLYSCSEIKWIDIETQRLHDHKCYEVSKAMNRLQRHDQSVPRGSDGAIHYSDIIEECRRKKFDGASQRPLEDWKSTLAKGGGAKKRFQYCLNSNSSSQFLYRRGHSGDDAIDPELQDNVLLPRGFTEYIYHVGNASGLNSIIRN